MSLTKIFENFTTFCQPKENDDFLLGYAHKWQMTIQEPATEIAKDMIDFHDYLAFFLIFIGSVVFWLLYYTSRWCNDYENPKTEVFAHSTFIEIVWTIIPAIILTFIGWPSFMLLYKSEVFSLKPELSVKIIGHQWYWSYEYGRASKDLDLEKNIITRTKTKTRLGAAKLWLNEKLNKETIRFDSYIRKTYSPLSKTNTALGLRLLEVDNKLLLPTKVPIKLSITSSDVIHSWAVPALGIKVDACPGRLSQTYLYIVRSGRFYGQCSEICGVNHGFMPIVVEALPQKLFIKTIGTLYHNIYKINPNEENLTFKEEKKTTPVAPVAPVEPADKGMNFDFYNHINRLLDTPKIAVPELHRPRTTMSISELELIEWMKSWRDELVHDKNCSAWDRRLANSIKYNTTTIPDFLMELSEFLKDCKDFDTMSEAEKEEQRVIKMAEFYMQHCRNKRN